MENEELLEEIKKLIDHYVLLKGEYAPGSNEDYYKILCGILE